jgi:chemotaxis methyl-accepting protein methylase
MQVCIDEVIKPLLIAGKKPRILSAPCAQGEEPYSLRQVPNEFTQRHFTLTPNGYQVGDLIRQAVKFLRVNLLAESRAQLTPGFNVVFCHNLMIYLDKPTIKSLLQVFDSLMAKIFADAGEDMAALEAAEDALSSSGSIAGMSLLP